MSDSFADSVNNLGRRLGIGRSVLLTCKTAVNSDVVRCRRRFYNVLVLLVPLLVATLAGAQAEPTRPSFADFLAGVKADALARGIRAEIVDQAFADVEEPSTTVIERDRSQAEVVQTLEKYLSQRVTGKAATTGREMLQRHHDLLEEI